MMDYPDADRYPHRYRPRRRVGSGMGLFFALAAVAIGFLVLVYILFATAGCAGPSQTMKQTGTGNMSEQTEQLFRDIAPKLVELTTQYGQVRDVITNDWTGYAALAAVFFGGTYLTTKYGARGLILFIQLIVQALTTNRTISGKVGKPPANKTDEPPTNNP